MCAGTVGRLEEKELEPWDTSNCDGFNLELDGNANGWDVNDMFHKNETMYGVTSTFDQSLTGYTIQIQKKDTQDFKDAEEQAEKIASEIENQPAYKERIELENGDEEALFAAVVRPGGAGAVSGFSSSTTVNASSGGVGVSGSAADASSNSHTSKGNLIISYLYKGYFLYYFCIIQF